MAEIVLCPWCRIPVIEHLVTAVEPPEGDHPGRRLYVCSAAPPFAGPVLVEPSA